jgi:manganese-dependent inorganic pyrophosphatase
METIVIGHRNPDMDCTCSAIAYAELKRRLGVGNVRAARTGALNERITFVLDLFGVPQPDFFPDATPRVRDVMVTDYVCAHPDRPVAEALVRMTARGLRALPVVDGNRCFHGVISENKLLGNLLPSREGAPHAREVRASLRNIAATLDGRAVAGDLCGEDRDYSLVVAAMSVESLPARLEAYDPGRVVLFVGDRENVQLLAAESGVRALVVTNGSPAAPAVVEAARRSGTTIIVSPWDTATSVLFARGSIVAREVLEPTAIKFDPEMTVTMARRSAALSNNLIFPVINNEGHLEGILSKSDFLKGANRQLVLVDHNEISQAVPGAAELPIIEILDHHRLGNPPTEAPILFVNRPVGSTCTLVAELYERHGIEPGRSMAGILMAGIISDTLNGTSPTTTETDLRMLRQLEVAAAIDAPDLAMGIFAVGSPLQTLEPGQVVTADCKEYDESGRRFTVSQIEEVTFAHFNGSKDVLLEALRDHAARHKLYFAALLVTDINKQNSYLLVQGDDDFLRTISYPEHAENVWFLEGVVSRKKQLLPYLSECLGAVR